MNFKKLLGSLGKNKLLIFVVLVFFFLYAFSRMRSNTLEGARSRLARRRSRTSSSSSSCGSYNSMSTCNNNKCKWSENKCISK